MYIKNIAMGILAAILLVACGDGDVAQPKPRAYLRIDMPEHNYIAVDSLRLPDSLGGKTLALPYCFQMNTLSRIAYASQTQQRTGIIISYPQWDGEVELVHLPLGGSGNLDTLMREVYDGLAYIHQKASGDDQLESILADDNKVYATVWHINGRDVGCTYMFVATDSTDHFLFGNIIINRTPNNDMMEPMLKYMQDDVDFLIKTLRWK